MNLYDLEQNYKNLAELLENSDDENLSEMIANSMEELQDSLNQKAENIVKYSKTLRGQALVVEEEIKRLQDKKASLLRKADSLESYLFSAMKFADKNKVSAGIFEVSIKKNPVSVKITDESVIAEKYLSREEKITVNKKKIKEDIKNGEEVVGAILEQKEVIKIK